MNANESAPRISLPGGNLLTFSLLLAGLVTLSMTVVFALLLGGIEPALWFLATLSLLGIAVGLWARYARSSSIDFAAGEMRTPAGRYPFEQIAGLRLLNRTVALPGLSWRASGGGSASEPFRYQQWILALELDGPGGETAVLYRTFHPNRAMRTARTLARRLELPLHDGSPEPRAAQDGESAECDLAPRLRELLENPPSGIAAGMRRGAIILRMSGRVWMLFAYLIMVGVIFTIPGVLCAAGITGMDTDMSALGWIFIPLGTLCLLGAAARMVFALGGGNRITVRIDRAGIGQRSDWGARRERRVGWAELAGIQLFDVHTSADPEHWIFITGENGDLRIPVASEDQASWMKALVQVARERF